MLAYRTLMPRFGRAPFAALSLASLIVPASATSVFFESSTAGSEARVPTDYGDSIYIMRPGININPAFKVDDGKANWSKDNLSGFTQADMEPITLGQVPTLTFQGTRYLAFGIDFNETGGTPDFDVINFMLWAGPASADTLSVATTIDPNMAALAWPGSVKAQQISKWESMLQMQSNTAANDPLGINLIYQQNTSPQLFASGDTLPYGSDPHRVYSAGLSTLGSNEVDVAILVPYSVIAGRPSTDMLYLGMQTGALADGGNDRIGFIDPSTLVAGGYFSSIGVTFSTVPEPGSFAFAGAAALLLTSRRRKAA